MGGQAPVDPDRPEPLWRQVLADLESRLASGELTDRFPTDRELVDTYGVSRHTVREAVRHLRARGVVERERGRGSTVRSTSVLQPAGTLYSLFRAVEAQGTEQHSEVLALERCSAPGPAARLQLPDGAELVRLERLRLAGDEPLALDTVWLPAEVGAVLLDVDFRRTALYDELESRAGIRVDGGREIITAVAPDAALRASLELEPDEGVLRIQRWGWAGHRPVEFRLTLVRGGRFALVSDFGVERDAGGLRVEPVSQPRPSEGDA